MQQIELELAAGDVVRIGDHWLTVVEFDGDEVLLRLSDLDSDADGSTFDLRPR
ncbi:MAG TPA: hypothetical protein VM165_16770 [Planctomycetaceae bacterium]|nr:hypothetical protein [Planctomycetaceae bacterium]